MVTTKAPEWQDRFIPWKDSPLTLGQPHEGFFYPDPIGFWAEVRKWSVALLRLVEPEWTSAEALSLTTLLHMEDDVSRFDAALEVCRPGLVLFLDEASWERSGLEVRRVAHHIADPYRRGKVYEGFWGRTPDGIVVGKSPQHPTMHNLYRAEEMTDFLRAAPVERAT